jgi:histidyl-tRNA synthetase
MYALETLAPSTGAGVITAIATVITAVGGLVLAVGVLIPILRQTRSLDKKVDTVHTIVNQQRTDAQRYNIALAELLRKNGIEVPIDQSLPVTTQADAQPGQPH